MHICACFHKYSSFLE
uniref:Uncharacterized protein n=1 Tax=Rhizophora mucronata TaxID=61149 RepID=A0A2P2N3S9_RHIMU